MRDATVGPAMAGVASAVKLAAVRPAVSARAARV